MKINRGASIIFPNHTSLVAQSRAVDLGDKMITDLDFISKSLKLISTLPYSFRDGCVRPLGDNSCLPSPTIHDAAPRSLGAQAYPCLSILKDHLGCPLPWVIWVVLYPVVIWDVPYPVPHSMARPQS